MYVDKERQINQPCFRFLVDNNKSKPAEFFYECEPVVCW